MIRQDMDGSVSILYGSVVIISADKLQAMLGFGSTDDASGFDDTKGFLSAILGQGGDIINMDISTQPQRHEIVKKYMVNNEGENQTLVEIRPARLKMSRFLMKGEPTRSEFFNKRFKELDALKGNMSKEQLLALSDQIDSEYRKIVES
jgi:hypothetical protein